MSNKENKIYKGDYGYISHQKKLEITKSVILLALPIAIYIMGFLSTGSNKNLLTFVAVLGALPFARSAVNTFLFIKAGVCCSEETFKKIVSAGVSVTFFDLYYTTYKVNYPIAALHIKRNCLIVYTEKEDTDIDGLEKHLKNVLSNCGGDKFTVKAYTDIDKFIDRTRELNSLEGNDADYSFIYDNLLSISI